MIHEHQFIETGFKKIKICSSCSTCIYIITDRKGRQFIVHFDYEDIELVNKHTWRILDQKKVNRRYAITNIPNDGKIGTVRMHVLIMGIVEGKEIDHIDGDGINNKRNNLRHATHSENMANIKIRSDNTTGFRGVSPLGKAGSGRYVSVIHIGKKKRHLGCFDCPLEAAKAYNRASKEIFGEFGFQNKITIK